MVRRALIVSLVLCASGCSSPMPFLPPTTGKSVSPAPSLPGFSGGALETSPGGSTVELATVQRVVDGDTFVALGGGRRFRVRLIGVDTPETVKPGTPVQCFGPEASAYTKGSLTGKQVRLGYDVERYDRYGRTLAYVWVGGTFFNLDLVQKGYAVADSLPPDVAHVDDFVAAQHAARASHLGRWLKCGLR